MSGPLTANLVPLKRLVRFASGGTPSKNQPSFWDGDIPWVSPKDMKRLRIDSATDSITKDAVQAAGLLLVPPGSVLIVVRGMILAHSFPVGLTSVPLTINQDMKALLPGSRLDPQFLAYLLAGRSADIFAFRDEAGHGTMAIRMEPFGDWKVPVLEKTDQRKIVDFLDRETARVDALMEKQRELIAILDEKRQVVRTESMTRGMDPTTRVSSTGSMFVPIIPPHWTLTRCRNLLRRIEQGWSPQCENRQAASDEWGVLKVGCVNGMRFEPAENKALPPSLLPIAQLEVQVGDMLMSRANTRELVGSVALVNRTRSRLMLCDKLYRLHFDLGKVRPAFMELMLTSGLCRPALEAMATGASPSMKNISQEAVRDLAIPLPPLDEQDRIVARLHRTDTSLVAVCAKARDMIDRLREHRTALITAAVTGGLEAARSLADSGPALSQAA